MQSLVVTPFFDDVSCTTTCVVHDRVTRQALVVDPVLAFDPPSGNVTAAAAEKVATFVADQGLHLLYVLETHIHADHITAAEFLRQRVRPAPKVVIGARVEEVQRIFTHLLRLPEGFCSPGDFDILAQDGQVFSLGDHRFSVLATPGHTTTCVTYHFNEPCDQFAFTGDTIFMPAGGTARCDFPGGSAARLYDSIFNKILRLPPETTLYVGHDYKPGGRKEYAWTSTVAEQLATNIHVADLETGALMTKDAFVALREARDATLSLPRLLYPSIQFNIRAGKPPPTGYISIPVSFPKI